VAQVAGIMAAKNTSDWIPMCHSLQLKGVNITFDWESEKDVYELVINVSVNTKGSTGVEMEALTAASAQALTRYDMCKADEKGMVVGQTYPLEKRGRNSGHYYRQGGAEYQGNQIKCHRHQRNGYDYTSVC